MASSSLFIAAPIALETQPGHSGSKSLVTLADQVATFIQAAKAKNTRRAYQSDWESFARWCREHGPLSLPASPTTVALYITDLAARCKASTIHRHLTSIARIHEMAGHPSPATMRHAVVSETLKGIRRTIGTAQKGKLPLLTADLQKVLAHVPDTLGGVRDRALLLVGFAGAFRRSELAALVVEQVEFNSDGLVILLDFSKTDPEGKGETVAIPFGSHHVTCPVRALQKWLEDSGVESGPLFRAVDRHGRVSEQGLHANSIGAMVKRACAAAGYNAKEFAGHSLRAGLATQAAANGVPERLIMRQTRHRSVTTLRRYIRQGSLFRENAAAKVGL
jgi:integrase